jgi:4-hydroxy-3-methylbut-2-enyl diphosphate reductase
VEDERELCKEWFDGKESVGISGATSTPQWLMERMRESVQKLVGYCHQK